MHSYLVYETLKIIFSVVEIQAESGDIIWAWLVQILVLPSPIGYMLWSFGFLDQSR